MLANPDLRRKLIVEGTRAAQAREGVEVSAKQAENSYYVVTEGERAAFFGLVPFRSEVGENDGRHIEFVRSLSILSSTTRSDVAHRDFSAIAGAPLAYDRVAMIGEFFRDHPSLEPTSGYARLGAHTSEDERMLRFWWEVSEQAIPHGKEYVPFAKGGFYCRFYYDINLRVAWDPARQSFFGWFGRTGRTTERPEALDDYFKPGLFWPRRTQRGFNVRILPAGCIFADKGPSVFARTDLSRWYLLAILNSHFTEALLQSLTSFGSWEVGAVKKLPVPIADSKHQEDLSRLSKQLYKLKAMWDTGNEISTTFKCPWILQSTLTNGSLSLSGGLDSLVAKETSLDAELGSAYADLNDAVYRFYGVNGMLRAKFEVAIGPRPPEIVWPQMEGKNTEQKRLEHVNRLLTYLVKRIVEADNDSLVCLQSVAQERPMLDRLREELHRSFPKQDPSALETEVVNELKKKVKGCRRAETLIEWLNDAFFEIHANLYQQRPLLWHLASSQTRSVPAFSVVVHAHKFDGDALAKLRSVHIRDRLAILRREAGQARQDNREEDRLEFLAAIEEVEAFDAKLKLLQEGAHTGPEGGDRDYRILTPWKSESERPQGWNPDLDDGIKVNIAPLARTGLLRIKGRFGEKDVED